MPDPILNAVRVNLMIMDCLYQDDELPEDGSAPPDAVKVEGITRTFGFHPGRLNMHKTALTEMLGELEDSFKASSGHELLAGVRGPARQPLG
jgi:hypothetical protein